MLNINFGKTFRMGKYFMGISANINNVLDNRDYVTGGFEQTRIGNLDVLNDRRVINKYLHQDIGMTEEDLIS